MTFIDFKKLLLDAEITVPKFANLIKVSEKNIQAYKKKKEVPNTIAVIAKSFALFIRDFILVMPLPFVCKACRWRSI